MNYELSPVISSVISSKLDEILVIQAKCRLSNWSRGDYQKEINSPDSLFIAASFEQKTVGFLLARFPASSTEADILNFGVEPVFQKSGIGTSLFNCALSEFTARNVESVWLEVRSSNVTAVGFYQKRNFQTTQTRKNFYTAPIEDALVMKLDLKATQNT